MTESASSSAARPPAAPGSREPTFLERVEERLEAYPTRIVLSFLIIISMIPVAELVGGSPGSATGRGPASTVLDWLYFGVFAPEFALRAAIYFRRKKRGRAEALLLALDLVAVVSFLPWHGILQDAGWVRLIRLSRLVLLAGYWGGIVRDLWSIVTERERRYQLIFVFLSGLILSFAATVWLYWAGRQPEGGGAFLDTLWWSFRQVQDPGNLEPSLNDGWVVVTSVFLTLSGLFLFSFVIGIGTGAIEELMARSRRRPVNLRQHTVILGLAEHSHFLIDEFTQIYDKNRMRVRAAVLGPTEEAPDYLRGRQDLFHYRPGDAVRSSDLSRVAIGNAKRVLVLGTDPVSPDRGVIASILALRDRNPHVDVFPDLEHANSLLAARTAGGARTHIVGSGSFVGNYIAQSVIFPGVYRIYRQLLTSSGCEIYTYVFTPDECERLRERAGADGGLELRQLHTRAYLEFGVALLGYFVAAEGDEERVVEVEDLEVVLGLTPATAPPRVLDEQGRVKSRVVRGVVGVALRWEEIRTFAKSVIESPNWVRGRGVLDPDTVDEEGDRALRHLRLQLPNKAVRRVVVCGESLRIPRVVTDLLAFYGPVDVRVLSAETDRLHRLHHDLRSAIARELPGCPITVRDEPSARVYEVALPEGETARVRLLNVGWSDATRLVTDPELGLSQTDVLLFLPRTRGADAQDGQVALDCLQLAHQLVARPELFDPGFRVLGMIQDPVKSDLLESRLDLMMGDHGRDLFTIISSERARHHFIVQNVFVRGLNTVFQELFGTHGPSICRLLPERTDGSPMEGSFDPWTLARHLRDQRGLMLIGLELAAGHSGADEPRVMLDVREMPVGKPMPWAGVRAIYLLGDSRQFLRATAAGSAVL